MEEDGRPIKNMSRSLPKMCLWKYAGSEDPDQSAHPRRLIRASPVRQQDHWILQNV